MLRLPDLLELVYLFIFLNSWHDSFAGISIHLQNVGSDEFVNLLCRVLVNQVPDLVIRFLSNGRVFICVWPFERHLFDESWLVLDQFLDAFVLLRLERLVTFELQLWLKAKLTASRSVLRLWSRPSCSCRFIRLTRIWSSSCSFIDMLITSWSE